jgi:AcrR family transcriptional regulator
MVSDIVKIAGVAQGTFYYYFKSKEAVLDEITDKYIGTIVESM